MVVVPIRRRVWPAVAVLVAIPLCLVLAVVGVVNGFTGVSGYAVLLAMLGMRAPTAWRTLRTADQPAVVTVRADRCVIDHPALFREQVQVIPDDLHSIVPIWLRPPPASASGWRAFADEWLSPPVLRTSDRVPVIGSPGGRRMPALVLVFRAERTLPQARSKTRALIGVPASTADIRGLIIAVDDLDAAQRAFQPWGLLARMTPEAFEWLRPRSKASDPGPLPVYGT